LADGDIKYSGNLLKGKIPTVNLDANLLSIVNYIHRT